MRRDPKLQLFLRDELAIDGLDFEQLTALRAKVTETIEAIRGRMSHTRAEAVRVGQVVDAVPGFRQAGAAARFHGRLLHRIEERLRSLRGELAAKRHEAAEQRGQPTADDFSYAAGALRSCADRADREDQRVRLERVAAWLRVESDREHQREKRAVLP